MRGANSRVKRRKERSARPATPMEKESSKSSHLRTPFSFSSLQVPKSETNCTTEHCRDGTHAGAGSRITTHRATNVLASESHSQNWTDPRKLRANRALYAEVNRVCMHAAWAVAAMVVQPRVATAPRWWPYAWPSAIRPPPPRAHAGAWRQCMPSRRAAACRRRSRFAGRRCAGGRRTCPAGP